MEFISEHNQIIINYFKDFLDKFITIYLVSNKKTGFSGVLVEANSHYIILSKVCRNINYCIKRFILCKANKKTNCKKNIVIPINKIVAIQHFYR